MEDANVSGAQDKGVGKDQGGGSRGLASWNAMHLHRCAPARMHMTDHGGARTAAARLGGVPAS